MAHRKPHITLSILMVFMVAETIRNIHFAEDHRSTSDYKHTVVHGKTQSLCSLQHEFYFLNGAFFRALIEEYSPVFIERVIIGFYHMNFVDEESHFSSRAPPSELQFPLLSK